MQKLRGHLPRNGQNGVESRTEAGVLLRKHPVEQRGLKAAISRKRARALSGASVQSTDEQVRVCVPGCVGDVRAQTWENEKEQARAH